MAGTKGRTPDDGSGGKHSGTAVTTEQLYASQTLRCLPATMSGNVTDGTVPASVC